MWLEQIVAIPATRDPQEGAQTSVAGTFRHLPVI